MAGSQHAATIRGLDVRACGCGGSIGTVLLHQFVVEADDEKRRSPLSDEERRVVFLRNLEADRDCHGSQRQGQINARRHLRGDLLNGCCYLIFRRLTLHYPIIRHSRNLLSSVAALPHIVFEMQLTDMWTYGL